MIGRASTGPAPRAGGGRWLALAGLLGALALLCAAVPALSPLLEWRPDAAWRQPWRWWSAAFVHLSAWHLGANLAGLLLVALLGRAAGCGRAAAGAWLVAWPLTHLLLAVQPGLAHYGGLSGVLHAGVAVAVVHLLAHARGARRGIGIALGLGLVAKIVLESPWGPPVRLQPDWDIPLAPLAHATGALAGAACAALAEVTQRTAARRPLA